MKIKKNQNVDRSLSPAGHIVTHTHTQSTEMTAERNSLRSLRRVERGNLHHLPCTFQRSQTPSWKSAVYPEL